MSLVVLVAVAVMLELVMDDFGVDESHWSMKMLVRGIRTSKFRTILRVAGLAVEMF